MQKNTNKMEETTFFLIFTFKFYDFGREGTVGADTYS
jgi:hypothetical protein